MYRDDPILLGAIPGIPPDDDSFYRGTLSLRRGVEPARSRRRAGGAGRVVARRRRQPALAHRVDQAAVRRPFQAGRADRLAVPRRRLRQPLRRGGGRGHRSRRHGQGDLGDVHALRSARGHGDPARLLVVGARSDGLWRERSAQRPRRHRRLQAVRPPRHVPDRGARQPGGRGPGARASSAFLPKDSDRRAPSPREAVGRVAKRERCSGADPRPLPTASTGAGSRTAVVGCREFHDRQIDITLSINGREHAIRVEPRKTLVDAIREDCGLTGTHIGCEHGVCGACTVIVGGEAVRSCLMFAVQAQRQADPHRRGAGARTARCIRCSAPSSRTTACNAASARRAS